MMMKRIYIAAFFTAMCLSTLAQQSKKELHRANALFDKLAFTDAIVAFREIVVKDTAQFDAKVKLADAYRMTGNYTEAEQWYAKVVSDARSTDLDRFHYGQMLMNNGHYQEAQKWLNVAAEERPSDERAQHYLAAINNLDRFFIDSVSYSLQSFPSNGSGNDFSPAFFKTGIVYTASRKVPNKLQRHAWTGESFTDLYHVDSAFVVTEFAENLKTPLNDGPASFGGNEMFVTVNVNKVRNQKSDLFKLNIFSSVFDGTRWSKLKPFEYNSLTYNVAHPALSPDGKRLFFASDMPGGEGGMDLYYCERTDKGWSAPVSLGKQINTPGNEIFPFAHADGGIYFASNGHEGLGGLDVYYSQFGNGNWQYPASISFPVNTSYDDFGFIISTDKTRGYFSSNRPGGKGGDDIYAFIFTPSVLEGLVVNKQVGEKLSDAKVELIDKATGKTISLTTDANGKFEQVVTPCREYEVRTQHPNYGKPVITTVKSPCHASGRFTTEVLFTNPVLSFQVAHRYTGASLDPIIEVRESASGVSVAKGKASELKTSVAPCKEYEIIAQMDGALDVRTFHKTSCIVNDEVVALKMGNPPVDPTLITGVAVDQDTKKTLDSTAVIVYDEANRAVLTITTDRDGVFVVAGIKNINRLVFFRNGYFSVTKVMRTEPSKKNIIAELPGLQLDKIIQLEGIYYDLGKWNIRPDAARVLDNLVEVLKENPSLEIELSAHTDSRGKDQSNLDLSDKRAKAAAAYIIGKGIAENRVLGKGYGETQLKNSCGNGSKCTEKQHQENRRTEVKVTRY